MVTKLALFYFIANAFYNHNYKSTKHIYFILPLSLEKSMTSNSGQREYISSNTHCTNSICNATGSKKIRNIYMFFSLPTPPLSQLNH
jgi:hypothetical protein